MFGLPLSIKSSMITVAADPFAVTGLIYSTVTLRNQEERPKNFINSGGVIWLTLAFDRLISTAS